MRRILWNRSKQGIKKDRPTEGEGPIARVAAQGLNRADELNPSWRGRITDRSQTSNPSSRTASTFFAISTITPLTTHATA